MATLASLNPTLADVAKRLDPNGKIDKIAELLAQTNEVLDDMTMLEANGVTEHVTTVRSGMPSATWRMLNYGVQPSKSTTRQVKDAMGMLAALAEVDKKLVQINDNTADFRLSEDRIFLETMNQQMASSLFYGNSSTDPEKIMGLAPRFNGLSGYDAAGNVLSAAGSGSDNTSIWLVCWGPNTVHGIYPKGSKAGFQHDDRGEQMLEDANGGKFPGYQTYYSWDLGLTVRDWRYVVRICNISVGALTKNAASGPDLIDLMTQAIELLPNQAMGRPAFYCNRTIRSFLRRQITNKANVNLSMEEVAGRKVIAFDGIPVRRCDQLLNTESVVS